MENDGGEVEQNEGPNTLVIFDGNSDFIHKFKVEDDDWNTVPNGFTDEMGSWTFTAATVNRALFVFLSNKTAFRFQRSKSGRSCWMRLPDTLFNHGERPPVAAFQEYIYVVGSGGVGANSNKVEKYIMSRDVWMPIATLTVPRRNHAIAVTYDAIYAIGGMSNSGVLATLEKYSISSKTWEVVTTLKDARHSAAAVTSADDIFVLGGFVRGARSTDFLHVSMPSGDCVNLTSMKITRTHFSAWIIDGKIFAVGGDNRQYDSVEVFDATKDKWEFMDILSTLRVNAAVCMLIK